MEKKIKCNVIVCGPAIGKTYLAEHDKRFIDLDDMKATYKYGLSNTSCENKEKGKLNRGKVVNNDSTEYAIKILEEEIKKGNIVLISNGSKKLLKYITENGIDYCLVYANIKDKEKYIKRMRQRGNNDIFIEKMTEEKAWKDFYEQNRNDIRPKYKIELESGQYLSDITKFIDTGIGKEK